MIGRSRSKNGPQFPRISAGVALRGEFLFDPANNVECNLRYNKGVSIIVFYCRWTLTEI